MSKLYLLTIRFLIAFLVIAHTVPADGQVKGCTDARANNYNPAASVNDGSCKYNTTNYAPLVKVDPLDSLLLETSGLQMANNYLWTFNDGGGAAAIYRIDTLTKTILQTVNLTGATNVDWEDIAFDGVDFYIGDFGNNANGARTNLKIYKFPIDSIPDYLTARIANIAAANIETLPFTYSDQGTPVPTTSPNQTKYDCEAMIADQGKIHLFSKNWVTLTSTHYVINSPSAGVYIASPVDTLDTGYLVTGADKAPGQNVVALLGYQSTFPGNHFMHILSGYSSGKYFNGNKRMIGLGNVSARGQAEGITFKNDLYGYISNERYLVITPKLCSFDISAFVSQAVLPLKLIYFTASPVNDAHKLAWSFTEKISNLQLQYSSNGADFTTIKTIANTSSGSYTNKIANQLNYYRIAWRNNNGVLQYSPVVLLENHASNGIGRFLLKTNGELSFVITGTGPRNYSFQLTAQDGKILARTADQSFKTGPNTARFSPGFPVGLYAYLTAFSDGKKTTTLLQVR